MEIYFSGTWGIIADSEWSSDDAQVAIVCRKLGYFKSSTLKHIIQKQVYIAYMIKFVLECIIVQCA